MSIYSVETTLEDGTVVLTPCEVGGVELAKAFDNRWGTATHVAGHRVSTVFLVIEHWGGMFYETAVDTEPCDRYATRAEAVAGHWSKVAEILGVESVNPSDFPETVVFGSEGRTWSDAPSYPEAGGSKQPESSDDEVGNPFDPVDVVWEDS